MTSLLVYQKVAEPFCEGKLTQKVPLTGHEKSRTPVAAPVREQNQTSSWRIGDRTWVMRAWARLWLALAIALSLFAAPLRAQFVYVANIGSNNVSGYTINSETGALTTVAGSPFAAGAFPASVAVNPSGRFAYVANSGASDNVSGYRINSETGALTAIPGSPFPGGDGPASIIVTPNGKFAYVANFFGGQNNVSGYRIDPRTGALTAIPGSPFPAGSVPFSVAVAPNGKFAYVANQGSNNVSGYAIDRKTGALTAIAGSPFPAGSTPFSVAVDRSGSFAYTANFGSNNVSGYTIDPSTGALTPIAASSGNPFPAGSAPVSVAVDPSGKFAYVANFGSNNVSGYTIDPSTGALTPIAASSGNPFPAGSGPFSVAVDPSGTFAYVANNGSNNVSGYRIDPKTGALTAITGAPFPAEVEPFSVAITPFRHEDE
jgi:6-phosphogluconolactonase (cycloisomerase 2 family)